MYGVSFIRRNRRTLKRAALVVAGSLTVLTLATLSLCAWLGVRSKMDVIAYRAMIREHFHPIWRDLAWRRIRKGDSIESVLKRHPPLWREDLPPYTVLRYYERGSFDGVFIWAKDGVLIVAVASHDWRWRHFFFATPSEEKSVNETYFAYRRQQKLEHQAFHIHRAITGGQDVFLARLIERRMVRDTSEYSPDMVAGMTEVYGPDYIDVVLSKPELTVDVTQVLHGNLQIGAILTFLGTLCDDVEEGEAESVFLHFGDARLYDHSYAGQEKYVTVPRKALDWYQSLTPDQVKEFEARQLAEWAERGIAP